MSLFAQQAAEKALKGVYIEQRLALPPRTHNLVELGAEVGAPGGLRGALQELTPVYFTSRYPDAEEGSIPAERFNENLSRLHVQLAEDVVAWARQRLSSGS